MRPSEESQQKIVARPDQRDVQDEQHGDPGKGHHRHSRILLERSPQLPDQIIKPQVRDLPQLFLVALGRSLAALLGDPAITRDLPAHVDSGGSSMSSVTSDACPRPSG